MDIETIKKKITPILAQHGVQKAALFGSTASGHATLESDIDLLVDLPEHLSLLDIAELKVELEDTLGVSVDLVEYSAIKQNIKEYVLNSQLPIYEPR